MDPTSSAATEDDRMTALFESLEVAAFLMDRDNVVTHVNEAARLILEIRRNDILRQPFYELVCNSGHYLKVRSALRHALSYERGDQQAEVILHVGGRDHAFLLKTSTLILKDGDPLGTLVTLHDVTYLRDKERARANLVAALSSELKAPLTSLSLAVEMLERKNIDPKQHEIIATAAEDLARIRDLSENLLNVARDDNTSIAVLNVTFDFARLISSTVRKFSVQAAQKEVAIRVHSERPVESYGDPVKLSWVLSTIISTALERIPEGSSIDLSLQRTEHSLRLSVADTGPGISLELRNAILDELSDRDLYNIDNGPAELSLSIAKEIIEAHRGRISIDTSSSGNTFTIDLPQSRCI